MARSRKIKPEFWSSETLARVSRHSRLTFIGLWNHCDDYGVILSSTRFIIGVLYPFDQSVLESDIIKEIEELINAGLLIRAEYKSKKYLIVRGWKEHQKVDNPNKRCYIPIDERDRFLNMYRESRESLGVEIEREIEREIETERYIFIADSGNDASSFVPDSKFDDIKDAWNVFAENNGLAKIKEITKSRKNAVLARKKANGFDLGLIFEEIKKSSFLLGENKNGWRVDFDFVFCSPNNWIKIMEGKYKKLDAKNKNISVEEMWHALI